MGGKSAIEWTESTYNPIQGCTKVNLGCDNCYAERLALGRHRRFYPNGFGEVLTRPDRLEVPLHWKRGRRIFVCAQSDLFHPRVPWEFICRVFEVMAEAKQHTFQVLTKRPRRMAAFAKGLSIQPFPDDDYSNAPAMPALWPSNVWAGVSIPNARYLPWLDMLARVPAPVRFVSLEPLLGPVDLYPSPYLQCRICRGTGEVDGAMRQEPGASLSFHAHEQEQCPVCRGRRTIDWVIAGGESGPKARPSHPDWFRSVRDQCQEAGVPFFFNQWGEWLPDDHCTDDQWNRARERYGREHPFDRLGEGPGALTVNILQRWALVGRRAAGAMLDGREHKEFPCASS